MDQITEYTLCAGQLVTYIGDQEYQTFDDVKSDFYAEIIIQVLNRELNEQFCLKNNIK